MVTVSGGDKLDRALAEIAKRLGKSGTVRAGFFENATYEDGTSVALVAAVQNFGGGNVPPRPFFTNAIANNSGQWAGILQGALNATDNNVEASLGMLGEVVVGQIKDSIHQTNAPPLAASTVKAKGFNKPLIDTATMLNSVSYEVGE